MSCLQFQCVSYTLDRDQSKTAVDEICESGITRTSVVAPTFTAAAVAATVTTGDPAAPIAILTRASPVDAISDAKARTLS